MYIGAIPMRQLVIFACVVCSLVLVLVVWLANRQPLVSSQGTTANFDAAASTAATATASATSSATPQGDDRSFQGSQADAATVAMASGPGGGPSGPTVAGSGTQHRSQAIVEEIERVDPKVDGWDSEVFSERASAQLQLLATAIRELAKETGPDLRNFFVATAQASELRPGGLVEVYKDGALVVRRWKPRADGDDAAGDIGDTRFKASNGKTDFTVTTGASAAGVDERLLQMLEPWTGRADDLQVHFKIIRVELAAGQASTQTLVELSGPTATGFTQHNSTWSCTWDGSSVSANPKISRVEMQAFEEIHSPANNAPFFTDSTGAVLDTNPTAARQFGHGIDYWRDRLDWRLGLDIAGPHGLAIADVDGDGLDDLFICEPGGLPNRLYLQQSNGTALDHSAESGVDWLEPATSALLIDLDNDADQDLVFTSGRFFVCCENDGQAHFTTRKIISLPSVPRSIVAADYDLDGWLDVYVCCYISRDVSLNDIGLGKPMPYHDANNGPANHLLRSLGNWDFEDVTDESGLSVNNRRFSYAAAWEDYDNDGDADLYVANDFGRNNLYRNDAGRFVDVAAQAGVEDSSTGMSVTWGDFNRDGWMDLYVGNMFSSAGNRIMYQTRFQPGTDEATRDEFRRLARGNSLFQNNGDGTFRDLSLEAHVTLGRWAWGSLFVDLNNDGWEDLVVGNGMITSDEDPGDL